MASPRPSTLILTEADVRAVLTMEAAVAAVERAFLCHGQGDALMPPKVYVDLPEVPGDFRAMPARALGAVGVKWVNSHPENPGRHGLPTVMGLYILSDPQTALPLAVMDATLLTAFRTGAAGAVASRHLYQGTPKTVAFIGCGVQSQVLMEAHRVVFGDFDPLWTDLRADAAEALAAQYGGRVVSVEEASGADILNTSTPSRQPVVQANWLRDGAHINAIGADAEGKQELDPAVLSAADTRVFVDDHAQATHSGEVNVPLARGLITGDHIAGTLGAVIAGQHPGREDALVTVFDSTGLAIQDVALAQVVHQAATAAGMGTSVVF
jgi:alanine dehydrogenase